MNCDRIESSLLAVVDGRSTREERDRVQAHLADCSSCARRMEQMRGVWTELDHLPVLEPSAGFDARLRARLAAAPAQPRWLGWFTGNLRLVAVVAALVAAAVWLSLRPPAIRPAPNGAQSQADFVVVKNLPVLENYDVVSSFDALSDLPGADQPASAQPQAQPME